MHTYHVVIMLIFIVYWINMLTCTRYLLVQFSSSVINWIHTYSVKYVHFVQNFSHKKGFETKPSIFSLEKVKPVILQLLISFIVFLFTIFLIRFFSTLKHLI